MSVDESQMLSQAMKFLLDPRPWKAVDGTTGGPLNSYFISFFLIIGFGPGYILLHAVATLLVSLQVFLGYRTLLLLGSEKVAALGGLLMALLYGLVDSFDFLHYSSELLPTLLLGLAFYVFVTWLDGSFQGSSSRPLLHLFIGGLALGIVPWCKLQALPIAGALGFVMLAATVAGKGVSSGKPRRSRITEMSTLCFGAVLPTAVMLAILAKTGATYDFWRSYILANLDYAGPLTSSSMMWHSLRLFSFTPINELIAIGLIAGTQTIGSWSNSISRLSIRERWIAGTLAVYAGTALFAACRPGTCFHHYAIFLVPPFTYIVTLLLSRETEASPRAQHGGARWRGRMVAVLLLATIALYTAWGIRYIRRTMVIVSWSIPDSNERIAASIGDIQKTRPIESVAIWGWTPGVYVLTNIPPATRDAVGHFVISKSPLQQYFRSRFLADLGEKKPDLFIDAVAPGTFIWGAWTMDDGYESDPELKEFINQNYTLVLELALIPNAKPVRFFARNTKVPPSQQTGIKGP